MTDDTKKFDSMFPSMEAISRAKILSTEELIQARINPGSYWNAKDLNVGLSSTSKVPGEKTKMQPCWYTEMKNAISDYKKASNVRDRLQAESRLCRIAEHIESPIVFIDGNMYSPTVEHWNGYRIPGLEKLFETKRDPATISITDEKNNLLFRALCGGSEEMCEKYLGVMKKLRKTEMRLYFPNEKEERLVGVVPERKLWFE